MNMWKTFTVLPSDKFILFRLTDEDVWKWSEKKGHTEKGIWKNI